MIIDPVHFNERPYKVPNQEESRDFSAFIEQAEDDIARMLLGHELWDEFNAAVNESGSLDDPTRDLLDGAYYTYNEKTYQYKGWVDLVRPVIFSLWLPNSTYKLTNIGYVENTPTDKSTLIVDQYQFQIDVWNKFIEKVGYSAMWGHHHLNSFYGFMKANEDNYPTWEFTCPKPKNRFDL